MLNLLAGASSGSAAMNPFRALAPAIIEVLYIIITSLITFRATVPTCGFGVLEDLLVGLSVLQHMSIALCGTTSKLICMTQIGGQIQHSEACHQQLDQSISTMLRVMLQSDMHID